MNRDEYFEIENTRRIERKRVLIKWNSFRESKQEEAALGDRFMESLEKSLNKLFIRI